MKATSLFRDRDGGSKYNAPVQRRRASAVRCNRLLAGQTYFNRFIGGAIHLHTSASTFGQ